MQPQLEMEVGAGTPTGAAGDANRLSGRHLLANPHAIASKVGIERRVAAPDVDLHDPAVARKTVGLSHVRDHARRRSANGQRTEDADVDPGVATWDERRRDRPPRAPDEMGRRRKRDGARGQRGRRDHEREQERQHGAER